MLKKKKITSLRKNPWKLKPAQKIDAKGMTTNTFSYRLTNGTNGFHQHYFTIR